MRVFQEKQWFNQWWLWLLLSIVFMGILAPLVISIIEGQIENTHDVDTGFWIGIITMILVIALLINCKLTTQIDENGLSYQFFPFHFKQQKKSWNEIENIHVRKYNPLAEYGGWGYRFGFGGKALNIRGNQGIQIKFTDGDTMLIGTQKPKESQLVIDKYFKNERV